MIGISTILIGIGTAFSIYSSIQQNKQAQQSAQIQNRTNAAITASQRKQEQERQRLANLESARKRREQLRQAFLLRGDLQNSGANQGSLLSSSLSGGLGAITAAATSGVQGINQNQQGSNFLFGESFKQADTAIAGGAQLANLGGGVDFGAIGSGFTTLGGAFLRQQDTLARLGGGTRIA